MILSLCNSRILAVILLATAMLVSFVARGFAADHATILMYHRFGEENYPSTNVTLEQFEEHLEVLHGVNGHLASRGAPTRCNLRRAHYQAGCRRDPARLGVLTRRQRAKS